ncbi:RNA-binding protein [Candidatus Peregrinibacteria bacterium]|nr:RNA-binding protein [Candidatus Peregrinibacteria bacterium]
MGTRLYVGGLSYNTTEDSLRAAFAEAGEVTSVKIISDRVTGRSRGFGFVEMADAAGATKAIEMWNGTELEGRKLTVNEARPLEERPRRSFSRDRA